MYLAEVEFFDAERGGRITPPLSGYSPQVKIGGILSSCRIESVDNAVQEFIFNKKYVVNITLVFEKLLSDEFHVGDKLEFYEGSKKVAEGVVTGK